MLHIDLAGRDPDEGCTLVPYEKGALLLRTIEQAVGRERFDAFLRRYFDHFAFRSITTGEFLEFIRRELPNPVPLDDWIFRPGIPEGADEPQSDAFTRDRGRLAGRYQRLEHARVAAFPARRRRILTWRAWIANSTSPAPAIPRSCASGC